MPSLSATTSSLIRTGRHLIVNYSSLPLPLVTCQLQVHRNTFISSSYSSCCSTLTRNTTSAFSAPSSSCHFLRAVKMSTTSIFRAPKYTIEEKGTPNTLSYRIYFRNASGPISPFHDIPCVPEGVPEGGKIFNMVVEIPRWTNHKMEIATQDPLNPIKQDVKKEKVRFVANCFPHHGYIWNYGAIPQTWENPSELDEFTGTRGDNDPIDVCEIGSKIHPRGSVIQVKVLGCFALIDEGETDWKILAIDTTDQLAEKLNDIQDIEKWMPGFLRATCEWFRIYKIPDGKPENQFAFNGEPKSCEFALKAIAETRKQWNRLIKGECGNDGLGLSIGSTTDPNAKSPMTYEKAEEIVKFNPSLSPAEPIDQMVNKWHYVTVNTN